MEPIKATDRLFIVGPTGTGKTTLMAQFVRQLPAHWTTFGIDPKPARDMRTMFPRTLKRPEQISTFQGRGRIHQPTFARGAYDPFLEAIWQRQRCTLVIDDLRLVMLHGSTDHLESLLVAGRERQIGVWSSMQRPIDLLELITEAEWIVSFGLQMKKDRMRMGERGFDADEAYAKLVGDHDYFVHRRGWKEPMFPLSRIPPKKERMRKHVTR